MELLQILYETIRGSGISWLEFAYSMREWEIRESIRDGERVAVLAFNGPEFHFASFGKRSFTRRDIKDEVLAPLIARYGYATTRTPIADTRQQRFNERFGFVRTGEDGQNIHYRIERI